MYFNSRHRPPALQAWRLGMRPWHTRRVHGRFRVERLIPASFNQTSRRLRRTQALEIDEAVHATKVQTIIRFVVRDLASVAGIRPGQAA